MRVLLVHACSREYSLEGTEELGICSIAAFLKDSGHQVCLTVVREGEDYRRIIDFLPQIVGFTTYSTNFQFIIEICRMLKKEVPGIYTVLGGCLPTYYFSEIMSSYGEIDYIIQKEGEYVWADLLLRLEKGNTDRRTLEWVKGLIFRGDDEIIVNEEQAYIEDLDTLPFPSRDILAENRISFASISTSRGCFGYCSFCVTKDYWRRKWRGRSIAKVVDEMQELGERYQIKRFNIIDTSFEDPGEHFERPAAFAREILSRGLKLSYTIEMRSEFYKKTSPGMLELMVQSGLCGIYIGIESFNDRDRKLYGKIGTVEDNIQVLTLLTKLDIAVYFGLINFNPYSTFDGIRKNLHYLKHFGFAYDVYLLTHNYEMYRGTSIYNRLVSENRILDGTYSENFGIYNNYRYDDHRIGRLMGFFIAYFRGDRELYELLERIHFYGHEYMNYLYHLKRLVCGDAAAEKVINVHLDEVKAVLAQLNAWHADWFEKLLDLAEKEWDPVRAAEISDEYLSRDGLKNHVVRLQNIHNRMAYRIVKADERYLPYMKI